MQNTCVVFSSVVCLALPYYSKLSYKGYDFRIRINCKYISVLILSANSPETFLNIKRRNKTFVINLHWSSCKVAVIFSEINES